MALRVWLPLNKGNIINQGLSSATITGTPSYTSNGKIGAYSLNGGTIQIKVPEIEDTKICTFSFWAYITSSLITSNWTRVARFNDKGTNAGSNMRFEVCPSSYSNGIYCFSNHNNASYGLTTGCITSPTGGYYDQWVHFCFTSDGTVFTRYMNGVKIGSCNYTGEAVLSGDFFLENNDKCFKQDVRIYDHCLSPKEVKEISKGLVAHYKLDNQFRNNKNITLGYYGTNSNSGWGAHRGTATYTDEENNSGLPFKKVTKFVVTYNTSLGSGGGTSVYPPGSYNVSGNTTYTYSTYIKAEDDLVYGNANFLYRYEYNSNGTKLIEAGVYSSVRKKAIGNGWYRIWGTFTTQTDTTKVSLPFYTYCGKNNIYYLGGQQLELGDTMTSYIDDSYLLINYEADVSGNGYNGTVSGTLSYNVDSPRYAGSTVLTNAYISSPAGTVLAKSKDFTINGWFYHASGTNYYASAESYNTSVCLENGRFFVYPASGGAYVGTWSATNNVWQMLTLVHNSAAKTLTLYVNGVQTAQITTDGTVYPNETLNIGGRQNAAGYTGSMSDFRIYATALTADDILTLYKTSGIIDNKGNTYTYEFQENKKNMMWYINNSIVDKIFANGLSSYTQTNCQVTLTDDGYRVYRPPNLIHDSSTMHNMWGGFKININNANHKDHVRENLQTGHKYIILYDVKGQTSKAQTSIGWTNLMGWNGGGLDPIPSNVQYKAIPANFESDEWQTFFYKWDLTDDVYKVCTKSYSSFVEGNTYLSYADFQIGWTYENTGALGTDVYIKNIRMYDITDTTKPKLMKIGIFDIDGIHEENNKTKIRQNEIEANSFIEI